MDKIGEFFNNLKSGITESPTAISVASNSIFISILIVTIIILLCYLIIDEDNFSYSLFKVGIYSLITVIVLMLFHDNAVKVSGGTIGGDMHVVSGEVGNDVAGGVSSDKLGRFEEPDKEFQFGGKSDMYGGDYYRGREERHHSGRHHHEHRGLDHRSSHRTGGRELDRHGDNYNDARIAEAEDMLRNMNRGRHIEEHGDRSYNGRGGWNLP